MRLGGQQLPIERLSATSLSKAITCPEAWRRRYLRNEREGFGVDRFVGTVTHSVFEAVAQQKLDTGYDTTVMSLDTIYDYIWEEQLSKEDPNWEGVDPEDLKTKSRKMAHVYNQVAAPLLEPIAVEEFFEERIPGVPVPVVGAIDVEQLDLIVERKTTKTKLSKPKSGWRLQGRIYQLMKRKPVEWQVITKQVTPQVVLGRNEPGLMLNYSNPDVTVRMIKMTYDRLNDLYLRYGMDSPWPTDGIFHDWMCDYCTHGPKYANNCYAWRGSL